MIKAKETKTRKQGARARAGARVGSAVAAAAGTGGGAPPAGSVVAAASAAGAGGDRWRFDAGQCRVVRDWFPAGPGAAGVTTFEPWGSPVAGAAWWAEQAAAAPTVREARAAARRAHAAGAVGWWWAVLHPAAPAPGEAWGRPAAGPDWWALAMRARAAERAAAGPVCAVIPGELPGMGWRSAVAGVEGLTLAEVQRAADVRGRAARHRARGGDRTARQGLVLAVASGAPAVRLWPARVGAFSVDLSAAEVLRGAPSGPGWVAAAWAGMRGRSPRPRGIVGWWLVTVDPVTRGAAAVDLLAKRAARSTARPGVSDTSKEEARAAARAALLCAFPGMRSGCPVPVSAVRVAGFRGDGRPVPWGWFPGVRFGCPIPAHVSRPAAPVAGGRAAPRPDALAGEGAADGAPVLLSSPLSLARRAALASLRASAWQGGTGGKNSAGATVPSVASLTPSGSSVRWQVDPAGDHAATLAIGYLSEAAAREAVGPDVSWAPSGLALRQAARRARRPVRVTAPAPVAGDWEAEDWETAGRRDAAAALLRRVRVLANLAAGRVFAPRRSDVRRTHSRAGRVLRALVVDRETLPLALASQGWGWDHDKGRCQAWARAVGPLLRQLTGGRSAAAPAPGEVVRGVTVRSLPLARYGAAAGPAAGVAFVDSVCGSLSLLRQAAGPDVLVILTSED